MSAFLTACSADLIELPAVGMGGGLGGATAAVDPPAGGGYRAYASALLAEPRKDVKFRPDLEAYLDGMAATTRRSGGYRPVAANERMKQAARAQALDMALGGYVGHTSRNGYGFLKRFSAFADPRITGRHAENAAMNWRTSGTVDQARARTLFEQWVNSTDHRRNLLNPLYAYVATGAVETGNSLYAVQIFWQKEGAPVEAPEKAAAVAEKFTPAGD